MRIFHSALQLGYHLFRILLPLLVGLGHWLLKTGQGSVLQSSTGIGSPASSAPSSAWRQRVQIHKALRRILLPATAILLVLILWQIIYSRPGANLPTPLQVWQDTWDPLIKDPFF